MKVDKTNDDETNCLKEGEEITISKILELAKLPSTSNNYQNMIKLDLPNCGLSRLPPEFGETFSQLQILFLSNNQFREMPPIPNSANLKMVAYRSNGMTSIHPDALTTSLQWVILTNNKLTELPDTIGRCTNLEKLMLTGNQITHLPSSIAKCEKLVMIRLASNALKELPMSVLTLPNMKWLAFSDNPCTHAIAAPELPILKDIPDGEGDILGEGGGGVTRKVRYGETYVAVKNYHGTMTTDGLPEEERRMATIAGRLESPCLIQVLGQTQGGAMVMEFLDKYQMFGGRPNFDTCWKDVYNDEEYGHSKMTCQQALRIVTGLLDALCRLHAQGICHGDFYGHNILIQPETKQVRLGDFGGAFAYDTRSDTASAARYIQQCELRSFAVLVEEILDYCLATTTPDDDTTTRAALRELINQCLAPTASFPTVLDWWNAKKLQ